MNRAALFLIACLVGAGANAGGDPVPVCVRADGTLRLIAKKAACASGEQKKLLAEWEEEIPEPPDEEEKEDSDLETIEKQLQELSKRVAALEKDPQNRGGSQSKAARITAPFEVVSRSGAVILRVAEKVSSTDGDGARVTIGAGDADNYAVRVYKNGSSFVAGIGQARGGTGLVALMDEGKLAAMMSAGLRSISVFENESAAASLFVDENGGTVAVYQGAEAVAYLTRSSHGNGGNLTLADGKGFGVFSAGSASDGGGEACLNRVTGGGQQRNVCLGVELPSMGLGK